MMLKLRGECDINEVNNNFTETVTIMSIENDEVSEELKTKFNQWLADGKTYAVPDRNGQTYDERLRDIDITRELEILKKAGWDGTI